MTENQKPTLDLRIPLPIIMTLLIQTGGMLWYAASAKASVESRIGTVEQWINNNSQVIERVTRVEEKVTTLKEQATRIEDKLDVVLDTRQSRSGR